MKSHSCEVSKEPFPLQKPTMCTAFKAHNNGLFIFTALSIILKQRPPSELMKHTYINLTVQGLLPYTGEQSSYLFYVYEILLTLERHFQRLSRLQQVCIDQYTLLECVTSYYDQIFQTHPYKGTQNNARFTSVI